MPGDVLRGGKFDNSQMIRNNVNHDFMMQEYRERPVVTTKGICTAMDNLFRITTV